MTRKQDSWGYKDSIEGQRSRLKRRLKVHMILAQNDRLVPIDFVKKWTRSVILESIVHDVTSVFRLVTLDLVKHSFREVRNVFKPTFKVEMWY